MINELKIQNFKCLRDTAISFEPLTVLIGPNDSGKTSILRYLSSRPESAAAHLDTQGGGCALLDGR